MGSSSPLPHLMGLHTIMRLAIYCSLAGVLFAFHGSSTVAINGFSTVDKRCCAFKHVTSGESDYEGSYRLIPDDDIYVNELPAECSYSCVYMKEGNQDDQFCFQQMDPSNSPAFSQCQAGPSMTSPLLTTPAPAFSPGLTQTTGQSPIPMTTSTPVQSSTWWGGFEPSSVQMTTSTTGQSPVPMTTSTTGQSPVPMTTSTTEQSPVPLTTLTTGQSPVPMTTPSTTVPPFSMPPTFMTTQEEEVTLSKVSRPSTLEPTGEEEVRLFPKIRRSTTIKFSGKRLY